MADSAPRPSRVRMLAATVALVAVSSFAACGVAELGFRLAGYSPLYDVYSKPSLFWVYDALLGWRQKPGATGLYIGPRPFPIEFETPIHINEEGLRGPPVGPKAPDEYRVLVLGDSVVAGFEVTYDETFTALLQERLTRQLRIPVRVINAGVRGYGTDQELLYYDSYGRALDPDLVLLVYSTNDLLDNVTLHRVRRPFGKGAFALRGPGRLEKVGIPVPHFPLCSAWVLDGDFEPARVDGALNQLVCQVQTRAADRSALFTFVSQALARMPGLVHFLKNLGYPSEQRAAPHSPVRAAGVGGGGPAASSRIAPELTSALLRELAARVHADDRGFFTLIRPPNLLRLADPAALAADIDLRTVGAPRHVDFQWLRFKNDAHYNARGHEVMARGLAPIVAAYARETRPGLPPGPLPQGAPGRITPAMVEEALAASAR